MKRKDSRRAKSAKPAKSSFSPYLHYALVFLIILLFAFIRFRLRDFPLERDEGEYAYMGQLILQGIPPYGTAYNMKLPGTYAAYAAILALFGQTPAGIHLGFLLINAATTLLVYFLGRRLFGSLAGVVACACYALLSTSPSVLGISAHATHFVVLPALAGILLLLKAIRTGRILLFPASGILTGLAFIMKQPGILFVFFAAAYLFHAGLSERNRDWKGLWVRLSAFSLGAMVPFALTCAVLYSAGVFDKFWFWTFSYAQAYGTYIGLSEGIRILGISFANVAGPNVFIWLIAAIGLGFVFRRPAGQSAAFFETGFLIFSFLAVCPGFYFRAHYFVLLLPAVALSAGVAVDSATRYLKESFASPGKIPVFLFILVFAYSVYQQGRYFFVLGPVEACRSSYGNNPFPESMEIGRYLESHAPRDASILVLGSEPQIYFYAKRHAATGYLYTYSLMETQPFALKMQQEMIAEIERSRPEYLVFVPFSTSWMKTPQSETLILRWAEKYIDTQYVLEGIVDIRYPAESVYLWGDAARSFGPRTQTTIRIYKRNN